jgi:hypothetical protein
MNKLRLLLYILLRIPKEQLCPNGSRHSYDAGELSIGGRATMWTCRKCQTRYIVLVGLFGEHLKYWRRAIKEIE